MSQLLPPSAKLYDQKFAEFYEKHSTVDYSDLTNDSTKCNSSLLPHLAAGLRIDITGMTEAEARRYIAVAQKTKSIAGTAAAVENVLNVCFQDAQLVEWFDDQKNLERGEFSVDVKVRADLETVYDDRVFSLSNRLIKKAKNVRSQLKDFRVHLPTITAQVNVSSSSDPLKIHPFMSINELIMGDQVSLETGYFHNATAKSSISEIIESQDINLKGGYKCQVEV